jgi:hypothetical protein
MPGICREAFVLRKTERRREAREVINRHGRTVMGRDGQLKVHPLLAVERDAPQTWLSGIKTLGLEL